VPAKSHGDIEDWIRRVMPELHPIVKRLDELICETIPGVQYAVKWKKAYYGLPELGWIMEMVAYDVSVNVVFFGGAEFNPPPPLGTTERTRFVKVKAWRKHRDRKCTGGSSKRGACRVGDELPDFVASEHVGRRLVRGNAQALGRGPVARDGRHGRRSGCHGRLC
jgi:hypothetical protein